MKLSIASGGCDRPFTSAIDIRIETVLWHIRIAALDHDTARCRRFAVALERLRDLRSKQQQHQHSEVA